MEGRTSVMRPMGPRSINRPPLPNSSADAPPNRRLFSPPKLSISPPSIQPEPARAIAPQPPSLSLSIPRPLNSKPSAPKIKLQINATVTAGPLFESYAGGPGGLDPQPANPVEEKTIRPESLTMIPAHKQADTFNNLRDLVTELETIRTSLPRSSIQHELNYSKDLSDEVFDEICRLGEGAGGGVHKVRHKPTGMVMARKTITALEAPRGQLERELVIAASANHPNIIKWYGVYMSPSSSEVKILMEICEGRSLDAVGRQMKELGAVVGEKIYGRLAEGVRSSFHLFPTPSSTWTDRSYRGLITYMAKKQFTEISNHRTFF
jgi:mitogen-activated protein kinase kinase